MCGSIIDSDKLQNRQFISKEQKQKDMEEKIKFEIQRIASEMYVLKSLFSQYLEMNKK